MVWQSHAYIITTHPAFEHKYQPYIYCQHFVARSEVGVGGNDLQTHIQATTVDWSSYPPNLTTALTLTPTGFAIGTPTRRLPTRIVGKLSYDAIAQQPAGTPSQHLEGTNTLRRRIASDDQTLVMLQCMRG